MKRDDDDPALAATAMTARGDAETQPAPAVAAPARRYDDERLIGRGGMGEVVSARDAQIGRNVAIKRMRDVAPGPKTTARFLREAKIQGQLEHPAIVPVYELSTGADGRPFFAMKQLAGTSLDDVIQMLLVEDRQTVESYPRQRLLRAFADVCLAVEFAHSRSIIHRDLKPANIMLGDFGEVYVLDWGIAKRLGGAPEDGDFDPALAGEMQVETMAGAMIGTPGYMGPEQIRGDADVDGRADVYALGCILFEILACQPLHPRGKPGIESAKIGIDARPGARAPDREIPPELDEACVAATQLDRAKRPATARELGDRVRRYLDGDRDVAMRRRLAEVELAAARAALEGGLLETLSESRRQTKQRGPRRDEFGAYSAAMRAAARALALDPQSRDAAELVGRLMLEPPIDAPPEVERKLIEIDDAHISEHAKLAVPALLGYLLFFPIMWLGGLRENWLVFGGSALVLALMLIVHLISRRPTKPLLLASLAGQVLLVGMYARGLTPLLVAPGVALITAMIYASHPRTISGWGLWVVCLGGVLGPLAVEVLGVVGATTSVERSSLVMKLPAESLDPTVAIVGLGGYVAVILSIAIVITRLQAHAQRKIQRTLQLQTWQLEQLVPSLKAAA